jgi:hypothetical protein
MGTDLARWLNELWTLLYAAGLTDAQKAARRAEVRSDVHDQIAYFRDAGQGDAAINFGVGSRTVRGVWADILWRMEAGREGETLVRYGVSPPLPWFSMLFMTGVIVAGCLSTIHLGWMSDGHVALTMMSAVGAGAVWLGLYLASHRFLGPLLIAAGTIVVAWSLWWTIVVPVLAVAVGVAGVRRAQRIEALLDQAA